MAICTLVDDALRDKLLAEPDLQGVLVGALHTENIGIEQIIAYVLANPHIRFIILCGTDGQQAVGHLPGQTLLALSQNGVDQNGTVIGALGKRPVLKNTAAAAIAHFRKQVEVINHIGVQDTGVILAACRECAARNPGPCDPYDTGEPVMAIVGEAPPELAMDPYGYFVIYVEHDRGLISVEHYTNQGSLKTVVEGETGPQIYHTLCRLGLLSRLDHAAYLGRELQRAEEALRTGGEFVQDDKS